MSRRPVLVTVTAVAVVLAFVCLTLRVPYVALVPGPVTNTLGKRADGVPIITVTGHATYPTSGHLDLTTVGVRGGPPQPLTLAQAVYGWVNPHQAVLPQEAIYPPGQSEQQVERETTQEMVDSQDHAISAALDELGIRFSTRVVVAGVANGQPAEGRLRPGDVITAVDGSPVRSGAALRALVGRRSPGDTVRLDIVRSGKSVSVTLSTAPDPGNAARPIVGVNVVERHRFPFTVKINLKDVGGPSAGLMFTLGIIDTLTPGQLNGGRYVAGTGTIDDKGAVGPIGGIQQKMVAAREAGATVFLAPTGDCVEAAKVRPRGLTLVKVGTLSEALDRLAGVLAGRVVPTC